MVNCLSSCLSGVFVTAEGELMVGLCRFKEAGNRESNERLRWFSLPVVRVGRQLGEGAYYY